MKPSSRPKQVAAKADYAYAIGDIAAPIASGSFKTAGMIVAPCSVRSMSEIATGVTTNLLTRAADVTLKERRPLVLMVRETPLHLGHLRTMTALAEMGAIILPPVPAFYAEPQHACPISSTRWWAGRSTCSAMTGPTMKRWGEDLAKGRRKKNHANDRRHRPDEVAARAKLAELTQEHRDLDAAIDALIASGIARSAAAVAPEEAQAAAEGRDRRDQTTCCRISLRKADHDPRRDRRRN